MNILSNLDTLLKSLQNSAATIGMTVAGLLVAVYSIAIMLNNDASPAARTERWERLKRVFVCAVIIAGIGAFIQFARGMGMLL